MAGTRRKKSKSDPILLRRLRKHFGCEPADLPVVEQQFGPHERPNLHLANGEMRDSAERKSELLVAGGPLTKSLLGAARTSNGTASR